MSDKWDHIRKRLLDLGWDVSVLDEAEAEVRQEACAPEVCPTCLHQIECRGDHDCSEFDCADCRDITRPLT